jgi:hypothetical protein
MSRSVSRRELMKKGVGGSAAAVAAFAFLDGTAQAAEHGSSLVGHVIKHTGDTADVKLLGRGGGRVVRVPVLGFPDGWRLRHGDEVLVTGPDFPVHPSTAMPLVTRLVGTVEAAGGSAVRVAGKRIALRGETVLVTATSDSARHEVYVVKNGRDRTLSCVALRPAA